MSWYSSAAASLKCASTRPGREKAPRLAQAPQRQAVRADRGLLLTPDTVAVSPCPAEMVLGGGPYTLNTPLPGVGVQRAQQERKTFQCGTGLAGQAHCALEMLSAHQTEQKGCFILFLTLFLPRREPLR